MQMRIKRNRKIDSRGRDFTKNDDIFLRLPWYLGQGVTEENIKKRKNYFSKHLIFNLRGRRSKRNQPKTEKKIQKIHLDVMLVFLKLSSTHHNHKNLISKGSHSSTDFRRMRKKKRLRLYPESRQSRVNQETARWSNRTQCLTPCPQIGRLVNRSCPLCSRGRARLRS